MDAYRNCLKMLTQSKLSEATLQITLVCLMTLSRKNHLHSINLAPEKYTQSRTSLDPFYIEANFDSDNVGFPSCGSDNGLTINQFMSGAFNRRISD